MPAKTVIFVSYDGLTDALGQSQVLPYVIGLSQKGYAMHVVSFESPGPLMTPKPYKHYATAMALLGMPAATTNGLHCFQPYLIL